MIRRVAVAATAVALLLTGCAKEGQPSAVASAETTLGPSVAPTAPATPTSQATSPAPPAGTTAPPTGPYIEYFRIKTKPSCPSSGPGVSYPGNPAVIEWKVLNVTNVEISIDGGLFGTYDATFTHDFPFSCSSTPATINKHTYTIKTMGGGPSITKSVTAEARTNT